MNKLALAAVAALCACGCAKNDGNALKMITEATFPPYEFLRGQEIVGIDVEICRAVAEKPRPDEGPGVLRALHLKLRRSRARHHGVAFAPVFARAPRIPLFVKAPAALVESAQIQGAHVFGVEGLIVRSKPDGGCGIQGARRST